VCYVQQGESYRRRVGASAGAGGAAKREKGQRRHREKGEKDSGGGEGK
jgi:hypothetical protein